MFARPIHRFRRYLLDRIVLRPSRGPIDHQPQQRVLLRSGKHPLECFVQRNHDDDSPPDMLVLKFPGTAGRAERSTSFPLRMLPGVRGSVWTWNPPGYGGSGGRASLERIADAAIDFWDQVTRRESDPSTPIVLCGNSLGCVTALHVAASTCHDSDRCGMILQNTPPLVSVVRHVADRYPVGRLIDPIAASLSDRMNAIVTASKVSLPCVFLQSELDTLVPPQLQQQVINAYAGNKQTVLLQGLSHGGIPVEAHEALLKEAIDWLWNQMVCLA